MASTIYIDRRGWKFKVMAGLGENTFKTRYRKPGKTGWHCVAALPWCTTKDEAQSDLDVYARHHRMREVPPTEDGP